MAKFPRAVSAHAEAELALVHQQEWICSQNTIIGCTNCSSQRQKSHLALMNRDMYNSLCSSTCINGNGWFGT